MKIAIQNRSGVRTFDCDEDEAILHAGLRDGLNLPYECATGTCGTCRARLISGDVDVAWKEAPGAANFKPDKGDILMCQTHPRSDCVLRVPPDPAMAAKFPPTVRRGIVRNKKQLTRDVVHFDIDLSAPITFEAGQFIIVETPDFRGARAYSMVNFGTSCTTVKLALKRKLGGRFSDWIFGEHAGDPEVRVFGPLGRAIFRPEEGKNIICIAGGSGIAGMMSILDCAVKSGHFRDHKGAIYFGVRTLQDMFYLEELSWLAEASNGNLEVTVALSDEPAMTPTVPNFPNLNLAGGFVHQVAEKAIAGRHDDTIVYIAGPPVMVNAATRALIIGGFSAQDIRYDKFS